MALCYLLSGVPGSPYFVLQRCVRVIFGTHATPLRTAIGTPEIKNASTETFPLISSLKQNYFANWFCAAKRPCRGTVSFRSTDGKPVCLAELGCAVFAPHRPRAHAHWSCWSATPVRFHSTSYAVAKDVVLFEHDRTRFFRLLSFFCAGQLLFWTYLAHFAFTNLRDTRRTQAGQQTAISGGLFGIEANLGSERWRYGFTLACLAVGGAIVGFGVLFCRRSVSRVVLHKGGGKVTVTTQSPLGANRARSLTVPLAQVACFAHRQESPTFIPLRVKGHRFYFLLDRAGTLNNPKLFDVTVGAYRPF